MTVTWKGHNTRDRWQGARRRATDRATLSDGLRVVAGRDYKTIKPLSRREQWNIIKDANDDDCLPLHHLLCAMALGAVIWRVIFYLL